MRTVLKQAFSDIRVEESRPISIGEKVDITGDGVPEALVALGTGGAYTDFFVLMRIEDDKPIVPLFKQKDGKVSMSLFLAGASVMNGETVVMFPKRNTIYAGHWSRGESGTPFGSLTNCSVEAYQWNASTKTFNFSAGLSNEIRPDFCREIESSQ